MQSCWKSQIREFRQSGSPWKSQIRQSGSPPDSFSEETFPPIKLPESATLGIPKSQMPSNLDAIWDLNKNLKKSHPAEKLCLFTYLLQSSACSVSCRIQAVPPRYFNFGIKFGYMSQIKSTHQTPFYATCRSSKILRQSPCMEEISRALLSHLSPPVR